MEHQVYVNSSLHGPTKFGTDLGENLLSATAKAGHDGTLQCHSLLEGIAVEKFQSTVCYLRRKSRISRSDDGGTLMLFPPWGRHSWRCTRARGTSGRHLWWSGALSCTLTTANLGGVA